MSVSGDSKPPVCLMIGNYDGVHLGHQAILARAHALAAQHGFKTAVLSFAPHPLKVLDPRRAPKLLQTPEQKRALLAHHGVDNYLVETFDARFAQLSPEAFVARIKQRCDFRYLLVGFNFRFGHQRCGDTDTLVELGRRYGFETLVQPAFQLDGQPVSSSRVRQLIAAGDMLEAARLLGRPYFLEGVVGQGDRRGRELSAPTANVSVDNELLPRFGVYASWTRLQQTWYRSITNLGVAPTIDRDDVRFETHLFDFDGDLYGHQLFVSLGAYLRPEKKFDSLASLEAGIAADIRARADLPDTQPPDFMLGPCS